MARAPRAAAAAPAEPPAPAPVPAPAAAPAPAPPAPESPVAVSSVPDPFDTAFAEAAAAEAEPPQAAVAPKKAAEPKPVEPAAAEPKPPESTPATPPAQAAEPKPAAPAEPPAEPVAPVEPPPPPPPPPPPQPRAEAPPQPQPQQYQEPPLFNAEEVGQLQQFYTDWPDVARATETMVRGIMTQTARRMYADIAANMAPYIEITNTLADRSQLSELQGQVTDYDTVAGQLNSWAARQPPYLRTAYEHVIKSGTAAEVVDLINRYKQDMQSTTPAQGGQPAPAVPAAVASAPAPAVTPPVNPAIAAAAARLAPVSTKRTNVVAPAADFDSAFAEFAKAS